MCCLLSSIVLVLGCRVQNLGFSVQVLWFGVLGLGCMGSGSVSKF